MITVSSTQCNSAKQKRLMSHNHARKILNVHYWQCMQ